MESVESAETHSFTRLLILTAIGSFVLCIVAEYLKAQSGMDKKLVLNEVNQILRAAKAANISVTTEDSYIRAVEMAWLNEPYRGKVRQVSLSDWIRETLSVTSSP